MTGHSAPATQGPIDDTPAKDRAKSRIDAERDPAAEHDLARLEHADRGVTKPHRMYYAVCACHQWVSQWELSAKVARDAHDQHRTEATR